MIRDHDSMVISPKAEKPNRPALVTKTRVGPSSLRTLANALSTAGRSATSAPTPRALMPSARRSSLTRCAACSLTSRTATLCPRRPNSWQGASPTPEARQITTATLLTACAPSRLASGNSFVNYSHRAAGRQPLAGQHPAFVQLVIFERIVVEHPRTPLHQAGHTRPARADFAGGGWLQASHPGGLQQCVARGVRHGGRAPVQLDGHLFGDRFGDRGVD